jgi:hypothetical protein
MQTALSSESLNIPLHDGDTFQLEAFKAYLESLLPLLTSATLKELTLLFASHDFIDKCTRWGKEEAHKVIYINKLRTPTEADGPFTPSNLVLLWLMLCP